MVRPTLYELDGANRVLPLVRSIVRDVVEEFQDLKAAGREQRAIEARPGGNAMAVRRLGALRSEVGDRTTRIERYLRELEALGIELRDLETGLVDFPALIEGEPAYFCWKPGDPEVAFWHLASRGFADRRPVGRPAARERT